MSVSHAQSSDRSASLAEAFHAFNALSEQLAQAYAALEAQVAELTNELARSRVAREGERQRREQLADRLSVLLEVLPAAVVLVDGRGRIDRFNPVAENLFQGLCWGRRWQEVYQENLLSHWGETDWLLRNHRRVSVSARALGDGGRILVMIDTTEQRELEARAQRQSRLADMGEMAAQLAHQIRTPLATALLYGGHLARSDLDPEQRRHFAATLVEGLKHTERLIGDMLAFSRGGHFQAVPVCLRDLLAQAVDVLASRTAAADVVIEQDIEIDGDGFVLGNRDALLGVIGNLLDNAIDHAGEGAHIVLRLTRQDHLLCITVEDDGPGVPSELRARIFDPFFTTRERGTGLGLAVAQSVVLAHGGNIDICEGCLGGACFRITLPRIEKSPEASSTQGEAS